MVVVGNWTETINYPFIIIIQECTSKIYIYIYINSETAVINSNRRDMYRKTYLSCRKTWREVCASVHV